MPACGQYQEGVNEDLQDLQEDLQVVLGELDFPDTVSEVSTPMAAAQSEGAALSARCGVFEVGGRASMGHACRLCLGAGATSACSRVLQLQTETSLTPTGLSLPVSAIRRVGGGRWRNESDFALCGCGAMAWALVEWKPKFGSQSASRTLVL